MEQICYKMYPLDTSNISHLADNISSIGVDVSNSSLSNQSLSGQVGTANF